jgi:hypothetical protein
MIYTIYEALAFLKRIGYNHSGKGVLNKHRLTKENELLYLHNDQDAINYANHKYNDSIEACVPKS